jgi:hypothetical protein
MVASHAEVCQIGDGELQGKDLKRLIGASIVGTRHADLYKPESVWRKVRNEFPESLQAATKIAVEDARAQWTTYDNLNQWFDDVKKDLLATGLVENEIVSMMRTDKWCQMCDSKCIASAESLTWTKRTMAYQLLGTRAVRELSHTTILCISAVQ